MNQKVLCKWEETNLTNNYYKNIIFDKWLPQNDILAHHNVKLFISHAGLLSIIETIYHGKPILAIPIFGDQKTNAAEAVNSGYALSLSFSELTEEKLVKTINELLNCTNYFENAQKRSKIMHDRIETPQKTIVYWVEYVIRHNGASHLKIAALNLTWYKYFSLDVYVFLFVSSLMLLWGLKLFLKRLNQCCRHAKKLKKI